jgi:DNA-3-methyladenine glycosylase II
VFLKTKLPAFVSFTKITIFLKKLSTPILLSSEKIAEACDWLKTIDTELKMVIEKYGAPPLWARSADFKTLVHVILEQQVSLASANACFNRLLAFLVEKPLEPSLFLTISEGKLREIGYSRQKINYTRCLAEAILSKKIDLENLQNLSDDDVKTELKKMKGIGDWSAEIYLSECLLRPDILPRGDIAMLEAIKVLKKLPARPIHDDFIKITEHWRPWRSVGSRLLWVFYLKEIRTAATGIGSFLPE